MESNNSKIPSVSELLDQDLNDEIVIMRLMSHPNPELVIAGLLRMIKEERTKFSEQIEAIYKRISNLELKAKNVTDNVNSVNQIMNFMKAKSGSMMNEEMNKNEETLNVTPEKE